jgi:hypothetical protein
MEGGSGCPSLNLNRRAAAVTGGRGSGRSWRGDSGVLAESNAPVEVAVFTWRDQERSRGWAQRG